MLDCLKFSGIQTTCIFGAAPEERAHPQRIEVDLALYYDARVAARSDRLSDALDYSEIPRSVTTLLERGQFQLLEAAGEAIAQALLEAYPALAEISVWVRKPQLVLYGTTPEFTLHRHRHPARTCPTDPESR